MCGRYFFDGETATKVEKELRLKSGSISMKSGDVTPAMNPVVITAKKDSPSEELRVTEMFWGIVGRDKKLLINARAESTDTKPTFSESFIHRRCIIPAAGFYEWDKDRNKVTFLRMDKSPIYLAGLYQLSDNKDSFAILTTTANESMIKVHDRMPLMIDKNDIASWLNDEKAAKDMLHMEMPQLQSRVEYEQLSLF
jgi:putative SOS response-associated peptidase YedK